MEKPQNKIWGALNALHGARLLTISRGDNGRPQYMLNDEIYRQLKRIPFLGRVPQNDDEK